MATKSKPKARAATQKIAWYLFVTLFTVLFILALLIAFESSTETPQAAPRGIVQIVDDSKLPPQLSTNAQFQQGLVLIRSAQAAERHQGMEIIMAAAPNAATPYIFERLGDPEPTIRAHAATMLSTYKIPDADVALVNLLTDPDAGVRNAVAESLLSYASQSRILYGLNAALSSRDPAVVGTALTVWRACAALDKSAGLQAIRPALMSSDAAILSRVLSEIRAVYPPDELGPIQADLERIGIQPAGPAFGDAAGSSPP